LPKDAFWVRGAGGIHQRARSAGVAGRDVHRRGPERRDRKAEKEYRDHEAGHPDYHVVEEDHSQGVRRRYRAMTSVMLDPGGACGAQLPRVGAPPCRTYSRYQPGWVSEWRMRHWPCFGRCGTQIRSPLRNRNFADSPLDHGVKI